MTMFLNNSIQHLPTTEVTQISPDSYKIRCQLPEDDMVYGLKAVQHVMLFAPNVAGKKVGEWNGNHDATRDQEEIGRPYTPVSHMNAKGHVDFVIKAYPPNDNFLDGGKFGHYLRNLKVGDTLRMKGPFGKIGYEGSGIIKYAGKYLPGDPKTEFNMICGGSGITPMLQLLLQVLTSEDERDKKISFKMVCSNRTQADILCQEELDELASKYADRLKIWYTIQGGLQPGWKYSVGKVDRAMLEAQLFAPSGHTACYLCGPPGLNAATKEALAAIGHADSAVF